MVRSVVTQEPASVSNRPGTRPAPERCGGPGVQVRGGDALTGGRTIRQWTDLPLRPERCNSKRDWRVIGEAPAETARHTPGDRNGRPWRAVCTAAPWATRRPRSAGYLARPRA